VNNALNIRLLGVSSSPDPESVQLGHVKYMVEHYFFHLTILVVELPVKPKIASYLVPNSSVVLLLANDNSKDRLEQISHSVISHKVKR